MPAEVEHLTYVNNQQLARTGVPWWGTGTSAKETQLDRWLTSEDVKAEIGFDVGVQPLYRKTDDGLFVPVDDAQETVKIELVGEGAFRAPSHSHIATVGSDYMPFPGADLVDLGQEIVQDYGAPWDTAGRLRGDRIIFGTIRLDELIASGALEDFDGSTYFNWLLLATSHDGSMALRAAVVKHRTVCRNTYTAGLSSAKSSFTIRHTRDIGGRAREAARVLGIVTKQDAEFERVAHRLAESAFELEAFDDLADHLWPVTAEMGDRAKSNRASAREGVKTNWINTKTINDDLRFTKWGVLNGVTEWAEHIRPVRAVGEERERKLLSTLFGGPVQQLREKTVEYLIHK